MDAASFFKNGKRGGRSVEKQRCLASETDGYPSDFLIAAAYSVPAEFEKDGTVKKKKIATYGGAMHKQIELYNSFLLDKNGDSTIGIETDKPADSLKELVDKGICEIKDNKVIYHGYDRSYSLKKSVLQRNAMRILDLLANAAPMKIAKRK